MGDFTTSARVWMYNRLNAGNRSLTSEFIEGVKFFINYACSREQFVRDGNKLRCPCSKCRNLCWKNPKEVMNDILMVGFVENYLCWTCHGETYEMNQNRDDRRGINLARDMVMDIAGPSFRENIDMHADTSEEPIGESRKFFDLLKAAENPIWEGNDELSILATLTEFMDIKADFNMSTACYDRLSSLMGRLCPKGHKLPKKFNNSKSVINDLGLPVQKIDVCPNGCMLFWEEDENLSKCKFCSHDHWKSKPTSCGVKRAHQCMYYFPLIPRLQRLFSSHVTAKHMRWHFEHERERGKINHPSEALAWEEFDRTHPEFASETRNVRLGLCSDGFSPFGQFGRTYSCWPVMITPYNLPPWMCMKKEYIFLTVLVPGPKNPKKKIDVYLQPLIRDLMKLWEVGEITYDVSLNQNFVMRAALLWTIGDFPAYAMLSGWSTAGKLACPYCMERSKAFTLRNGKKTCWFDCHRQFLPMQHPLRKNRKDFVKDRVEIGEAPPRLSSQEVWERVCHIPKVVDTGGTINHAGYGKDHNWTKQVVFWDLPYWRTNMLRHNLDVMHIIKNFFDNIMNTVLDVAGKTKDNLNSRLDIAEICLRPGLEVGVDKNKKTPAIYCLDKESKKLLLEWVSNLAFPDGYASNLSRCVLMTELRLQNMKSHDCHVFMQRLIPVAFRDLLSEPVWKALTEISLFFRDLCSAKLEIGVLKNLEKNIALILCKLEMIFPPSFFDSMEHIHVHLPYEALVGGPVQYRWMYPFERFLQGLKKYVRNKARVEASICNAYLIREASIFASHYFDCNVETGRRRVYQHDDSGHVENRERNFSIFTYPGQTGGHAEYKYLDDAHFKAAHTYFLTNCEEVQPFIDIFRSSIVAYANGITEDDLASLIEEEFPNWFRLYVVDPNNGVTDPILHSIAQYPLRRVRVFHSYKVNGFSFQSVKRNEGKLTSNSGVCIKAFECEFFGTLKEVVELEYAGLPLKRVYLFHCDWFDPRCPIGTRIHPEYKLVEINHKRRLSKFEPYALAQQASQVTFLPYPSKRRNLNDWWAVCYIKPRGTVTDSPTAAFQLDELQQIINIHEDVIHSHVDHNADMVGINEHLDEEDYDEDNDAIDEYATSSEGNEDGEDTDG